jgi:sugar phosphate permease
LPEASFSPQTRRVVLFLAAAVFIKYFDRGNLAIASSLFQTELGLSNSQLGILFSAFFWTYDPTPLTLAPGKHAILGPCHPYVAG